MRISHFDRLVTCEFSRPADVTPYTSGDAIAVNTLSAPPLIFPFAGRSISATGYVRYIRALTNQSTCTAVLTLWLFNAPPVPDQDNAPYSSYWDDRSKLIGKFTLPALAQAGSGDYALAEDASSFPYKIYSCAVGDAQLYGQLVTGSGFTPTSGQTFRIELGVNQNEFV